MCLTPMSTPRASRGGQYSLATATGLFKSTISMLMVVTANKIAKLCGESGLY